MTSWNEIRKAATAFSKRWKNAYDEKAQAQSFLKEFFAVFGVDAVRRCLSSRSARSPRRPPRQPSEGLGGYVSARRMWSPTSRP